MESALAWAWWPAGGMEAWDWGWRAYPGVWLAVGLPALVYLRAARRHDGWRTREAGRFFAGLAVLWLALDWPLGPLAAGHLLAARSVQYLLISLVAAPLILLGLPDRSPGGRAWERFTALGRHPVAGAVAFGAVLLATHTGGVVDAATPSQAGSFAVAAAWAATAMLFWWPLVGPGPDAKRLPYLGSLVYLFLPFVLPKGPGIVYAFSNAPLYAPFADASGAAGFSPVADQQFAGFLYWIIGSVLVLVAFAVLFFRWYAEDRRMAGANDLSLPADPRAVALLFQVPDGWPMLEMLLQIVREALPPGHRGADLAFAYRTRGETTQVVLELRAALRPAAERTLVERVEREFAAALDRLNPATRALVAERLAFRLVAYGTRVR